jgi:glycosyltransferase involved in cell wall biosynthesis
VRFPFFARYIYKLWTKWNQLTSRKFTTHNYLYCFFASKTVKKLIEGKDFDCIVIGAGEPQLAAFLRTSIPIIYIADTTFARMVNYYPWHTGLCATAINQGNDIERRMIRKSFRILYSSQWATDSAVSFYEADRSKVLIAGFGPCLKQVPDQKSLLEEARAKGTCELLFIGMDWERKGGPMVIDIYRHMKKSGIPCHLTVVGSDPGDIDLNYTVIPFLDKNNPIHQQRLNSILLATDFVILPSKADCTPVVLSEAAAFGIPVLTRDTGGIPCIVLSGKNGYCLPTDALPQDFSELIQKIWQSDEAISLLRLSSRVEYEKRLNWELWKEKFNEAVGPLLHNEKKSTDNNFRTS